MSLMFGEKRHIIFWVGILLICLILSVLAQALLTFSHVGVRNSSFWVYWAPPIYWCIMLLPIGLQMIFGGIWSKLSGLRFHLGGIVSSVFLALALWASFEIIGAFLYVQQWLTHASFCRLCPWIISPLAQSLWQPLSAPVIEPTLHAIIAFSLFSFGWGFFSLQVAQSVRHKLVDLRITCIIMGWCTWEIAGAFIYVQYISNFRAAGSRLLILSPSGYLLSRFHLMLEQVGSTKIIGSFEVVALAELFLYLVVILAGLFISWALILRRLRNP